MCVVFCRLRSGARQRDQGWPPIPLWAVPRAQHLDSGRITASPGSRSATNPCTPSERRAARRVANAAVRYEHSRAWSTTRSPINPPKPECPCSYASASTPTPTTRSIHAHTGRPRRKHGNENENENERL